MYGKYSFGLCFSDVFTYDSDPISYGSNIDKGHYFKLYFIKVACYVLCVYEYGDKSRRENERT